MHSFGRKSWENSFARHRTDLQKHFLKAASIAFDYWHDLHDGTQSTKKPRKDVRKISDLVQVTINVLLWQVLF